MKDLIAIERRNLTAAEFQGLADVPPELEWFANITNAQTRRAYKCDVTEFSTFAGIQAPEEIRLVTRAHVIVWREQLETRELALATIRRKLSAISSLFDYLLEKLDTCMSGSIDEARKQRDEIEGERLKEIRALHNQP